MPANSERQIQRRGGAARYRTIKSGDKTMTCAVTRKPGPQGGRTVCWERPKKTQEHLVRAAVDALLQEATSRSLDMDDPVWKATGIMYGGQGMWTPEEFQQKFGFSPKRYPQYFEIMPRTDLVVYTPQFRRDAETRSRQIARNLQALLKDDA